MVEGGLDLPSVVNKNGTFAWWLSLFSLSLPVTFAVLAPFPLAPPSLFLALGQSLSPVADDKRERDLFPPQRYFR